MALIFVTGFVDPEVQLSVVTECSSNYVLMGMMPNRCTIMDGLDEAINVTTSAHFSTDDHGDDLFCDLFISCPRIVIPNMCPLAYMVDPNKQWGILCAEMNIAQHNTGMESLMTAVAVSQLMPPTSPTDLESWYALAKCIIDLEIRVLCLMYATEGLSCTLLQNILTHMSHDAYVISANPNEAVGLRTSVVLGIGPRVHISGPWARTPFDCTRWRAWHRGSPTSWAPLPRIVASAGPNSQPSGCGSLHQLRLGAGDDRGDGNTPE